MGLCFLKDFWLHGDWPPAALPRASGENELKTNLEKVPAQVETET
jgi:hypothetical protein